MSRLLALRGFAQDWLLPPAINDRVGRVFRRWRSRKAQSVEDDIGHPERLAVLPYLRDPVLEIGCGYRKTTPSALAIDLTFPGSPGDFGNVAGRASQADFVADGSKLPFRDGVFRTVLARHNLEHYVDTLGVLLEWRRVLTRGGSVVVVVPDEERFQGRTVLLDPTHFTSFTEGSLTRLFGAAGLEVVASRVVVDGWSLLVVGRATPE